MTALNKASLAALDTVREQIMPASETALKAAFANLNSNSDVSTSELLKLQYEISKHTLTISILSACCKEFSDCMKQTTSKF